jgi:hypothetical protein
VTVTRPQPPALSGPAVSNGLFSLLINGDAGPDYVVETCSNLAGVSAWLPPPRIFPPRCPLSGPTRPGRASGNNFTACGWLRDPRPRARGEPRDSFYALTRIRFRGRHCAWLRFGMPG